ncbi:MAG TPA: anthranilate synthase component I [Vicinamibacteria bacterium]|nr:anthranilate synthase component I [Vicinamibacteria bacterium]
MKGTSFAEYERLSASGGLVPVSRELPGDLLTPVGAFLSLGQGAVRAFLLESVVGGERLGRYSFLGRDPAATLEVRGGRVLLRDRDGERERSGTLLDALREALRPRAVPVPGLPRLTGGAVGYLTYDAIRLFERIPDRHRSAAGLLASFSIYRSLVAFDHVRQRLVLIALAEPGSRSAYEAAERALDELAAGLRRAPAAPARGEPLALPGAPFEDGAGYEAAVSRAREYIARGDIFQVVLSRQRQARGDADAFAVYRALRTVNPSPYMYFLKEDGRAVAGASPEMLVRVEGARVEARPIAGTRPRGATPEDDERLGRELLADPKERAEHLMLVDLGRNDLGRVCRYGSVRVPELMVLERYSHVMHIVSSLTGELREGRDALDALAATFPAGTLSGAPKIRAMEIIDELEPAPRGLYGGALGYADFTGNLDFCIAIRTVVVEAGRATLQAGAGIVADSDPSAERRETEAKALAMLEALRLSREIAAWR